MVEDGPKTADKVDGGFVLPWQACPAGFEDELYREVGDKHVLHGVKAKSVARRVDCDDVLFELANGPKPLAVVHLTWAGKEKNPQWPSTEFFDSWEAWREERMLPDVQEYNGG